MDESETTGTARSTDLELNLLDTEDQMTDPGQTDLARTNSNSFFVNSNSS